MAKAVREQKFPNKLREWRERRKLTLEAVATKSGFDLTKVHRLEVGTRRLKVDDAEVLASIFNVPAHALMAEEHDAAKSLLETIMVKQRAHAGVWLASAEIDASEWTIITIPRARSAAYRSRYGVTVADDSMDMLYPAGSIVIATAIKSAQPKPGQRVIVKRTRGDGRVELTVREFQLTPDGRQLLWPRSTRPEHQQPYQVGSHGDITTVIDALVVGAYRSEE